MWSKHKRLSFDNPVEIDKTRPDPAPAERATVINENMEVPGSRDDSPYPGDTEDIPRFKILKQ